MRLVVTRVLIVATTTGYQIRSFGEAAEKLGVRLVFASDRCDQLDDPWWDQAIPIRFHDELGSVQAIVDASASILPTACMAVGDRPVTIAARVNEAFGLPGNPPAAPPLASRNKLESRRALQAARPRRCRRSGRFRWPTDPREISLTLSYPAVVKPLAMSGSRGVIRVNSAASSCARSSGSARCWRSRMCASNATPRTT